MSAPTAMHKSQNNKTDSVVRMKAMKIEYDTIDETTKLPMTTLITIPKPKLDSQQDENSKTMMVVQVQFTAFDTSWTGLLKKNEIAAFIHDLEAPMGIIGGYHYAGTITEVGSQVSNSKHNYQVGDQVFGFLPYMPTQQQGALSEFIMVSPDQCAKIPFSSSMGADDDQQHTLTIAPELAAAASMEGVTALQALRDEGEWEAHTDNGNESQQSRPNVLIIGGGGAVGGPAIGIAKAMGGKVTTIVSTKDVQRMKELGADVVLDRQTQKVMQTLKSKGGATKFDIIFDTPNTMSMWKAKGLLQRGGVLVKTLPDLESILLPWFYRSIFGKKLRAVLSVSKKDDLERVGSLVEEGKVQVPIQSILDIKDLDEATKQFHSGVLKKGRIVIKVEGGW